MEKLVMGVGINDRKYPTKQGGKITKEYILWHNMLMRLYSIISLEKQPTYKGCYISDNFKSYSYFYEWCQNQIGFGACDYNLDKDLIYKGNKLYSENTCIFIPRIINSMLTNCKAARGILPIGVNSHGSNFQARCNIGSTRKTIGTFTTPELAFEAYKIFKENYIKELAEKYKETIDPRAYQALMNYEVDIND